MSEQSDPSPNRWFAHRKRVVAREVQSAASAVIAPQELETSLANVEPAGEGAVEDARPELVLDPTALGVRHRKASHTLTYRLTQITTLLAYAGATWGVVSGLLGDALIGRICACAAAALALLANWLARQNSLSSRVRGYAVGAAVLSVMGLIVAFAFAGDVLHDDPPPVHPGLEHTTPTRPPLPDQH